MEKWFQVIGLISAALTTSAFVPQAVKTWRTRSTHDLSPMMFTLFCIGITGWLIYGILINDLPVILSNAVTILFAGSIMYQILIGSSKGRIVHVGLYVNNLELEKDFYIRNLGAKAGEKYVNPAKGFSSYFLSFSSGSKIELMSLHPLNTGIEKHWGHIAISVGSRNDVDACFIRLEPDVKVINNPRVTGDGFYEFVISDPEGNYIEIVAE